MTQTSDVRLVEINRLSYARFAHVNRFLDSIHISTVQGGYSLLGMRQACVRHR